MDIKMDNHTAESKRQMEWMSQNLKVKTHILASDLTGHTTQNAQEVVKGRKERAQIKKSNIEIRSVSDSEVDCRQFNLMEIQ
jgi:D-ribose pyranose/furanose isomerase RbsD